MEYPPDHALKSHLAGAPSGGAGFSMTAVLAGMKFGNFLFPQSAAPDEDFRAVSDALREAELSEALGFDEVWLGEHHMDGACAYVTRRRSRRRWPRERGASASDSPPSRWRSIIPFGSPSR